MTIDVRRAGPADLDAIDRIEATGFAADRFPRRNLAWMLKSRSAVALLAGEGRGLGYAIVLFRRGAGAARLYSIATHPDARGRGVAAALVEAAEAWAIKQGCDRLRLEVRASNAAAARVYRRAGFAIRKESPGYYYDGETALHMEKRIGAAEDARL